MEPVSVFRLKAPSHETRLSSIAGFLIQNPELARKPKKGDSFGSENYWNEMVERFVASRLPRSPQEPTTVPDPMVSVILEEYFNVPTGNLESVAKQHSLAMAAENIVGDILERYIASVLEPHGWVWCSGEVVKKIDFLAPSLSQTGSLVPIQIKNRDNSENSSSSSVRDGTQIIKWFRTFSRTGKTNWEAFPELTPKVELSEEKFRAFAREYLEELSEARKV